jgi:hypothetical protein
VAPSDLNIRIQGPRHRMFRIPLVYWMKFHIIVHESVSVHSNNTFFLVIFVIDFFRKCLFLSSFGVK